MKEIVLTALFCSLITCSNTGEKQPSSFEPQEAFSKYWYSGVAELNRYKLSQARYGEQREGDVVLIFVTEDFLLKKQVKDEGAKNELSTSVLKTNYIKKFTTGIYDYSLMSSVFTPINSKEYPSTIKVTTSSQEWCGHTYLQLNKNNTGYQFSGHSYFMNEGDEAGKFSNILLEDELFNRIRINYHSIPIGELELLPSTQWLRLSHNKVVPQKASISLSELKKSAQHLVLKVNYLHVERELSITFEKAFPHKILGWEESYPSGYGNNKKTMQTSAILDTTILSPYWNKNTNSDLELRELFFSK